MEVLELVLKGLLNESWEENDAIDIHSYVSTKLNDTKATEMNLPYSVLGFIPWFNPHSNSKMGDEPIPSGGFDLFLWLLCLFNPILAENLHSQMAMSGGEFYKYLVGFTASILMSVMTFLGDLLWLIARAALLILAYIFVGIHIAVQTISYLTIGASMLLLSAFFDGYCEFSWNFVEFSINDPKSDRSKVIRMESTFTWLYWEFFDMSFPWVVDKIYQDEELVFTSKSALIQQESEFTTEEVEETIESVQDPPSLHCNYELVDGTTYDFWTMYDDSKKGGDAPDSTYGVKLHLIAPNGSALEPIQMSVHSDYLPNPNYDYQVKYNYTIDLLTLYIGDGLWHYYFSSKDDSGEHSDPSVFPNVGYLLGPEISGDESFVGLIVGPETPPGFKSDDFYFKVLWSYNSLPDNVSLCLIPAVKDLEGTGVSRTTGIKKYNMTIVEEPVFFDDEYEYTLNFDDLNYLDSELGQFNHYYEATLSDGSKVYLYGIEIDSDEKLINRDFNAPFVAIDEPQLVEYCCYSAVPLLGLFEVNDPQKDIQPIKIMTFESEYYFEVVFIDPNNAGPPNAKLIFENVVTGEEIEFDMDLYYLVTPFSRQYGEDAYSCMYHFYGYDLPPGMWRFRFEAKDGLGVSTNILYSRNKLWCIGGLTSMYNAFQNTMNFVTTIPLALFTLSTILANKYPQAGIALAFVAGGISLVSLTVMGLLAAQADDAGCLLGYIGAMFFSSMAFGLMDNGGVISSLIPTKLGIGVFKQMKSWGSYQIIITLIRTTLSSLDVGFVGPFLGIIDFLWLPVEVITALVMGMIGRFSLELSGSKNAATAPIYAFLSALPYLTMAYGIIASTIFLFKTQAYAFFF